VCIRLRNDLYCVGWGVKLYSLTHSLTVCLVWCLRVVLRVLGSRYARSRVRVSPFALLSTALVKSLAPLSPNSIWYQRKDLILCIRRSGVSQTLWYIRLLAQRLKLNMKMSTHAYNPVDCMAPWLDLTWFIQHHQCIGPHVDATNVSRADASTSSQVNPIRLEVLLYHISPVHPWARQTLLTVRNNLPWY